MDGRRLRRPLFPPVCRAQVGTGEGGFIIWPMMGGGGGEEDCPMVGGGADEGFIIWPMIGGGRGGGREGRRIIVG